MKSKITNFVIYIIVFIIIFASFIIPNKLFEMQDQSFEMAVYTENKPKGSSISVEAEDIYLVKALHDIESEKIGVIISSSEILTAVKNESIGASHAVKNESITTSNQEDSNKITKIKSELKKLNQCNIIKNNNGLDEPEMKISIINKEYKNDKTKYIINSMFLITNDYNCKFDIEEKTGKIIWLIVNKENINNSIEKREIIENYIKYLDLYIIDDWVYENNIMKSKKAGLSISLIENVNNGIYMLSVHSNEKISGNLIECVETEN